MSPTPEVSPYLIEKKLAEGGMGRVFVARHEVLGRRVALKVLHAHIAARPEALARFRQEAAVLARLEHAHAVQVYDFVSDRPEPFLVMELVEGESLAARLQREGPLPFEEVATVADQVLQLLECAHERGIIHRDLKPANVMQDATHPEVFVRVVDFGTALLQEQRTPRLTEEGHVTGTAAYMSPEQVNGEALDARSDLYALACVLFELLTGQPVFGGSNVLNVLSAHVYREPPTIEDVSTAQVPAAWQAVLRRALSKPRTARYDSAADMRGAFRAALTTLPRGESARGSTPEFPGFVAAQVGAPPVCILAERSPAELRKGLAEALAGVGVQLTQKVNEAAVVIVAEPTTEQTLRVAQGLVAQHTVLVCGAEDDWALLFGAVQRRLQGVIFLPLVAAEAARQVVSALETPRSSR